MSLMMGTRRFDNVSSAESIPGRDQHRSGASGLMGSVTRNLRGTVEGHADRV